VLNVVHGYGAEDRRAAGQHTPDVRAISFTGSTATGNRIVKSAGLKKFQHGAGRQEPVS
jgi:5-carboxymethyl-2-hydroxymuconic-semialdehyde dehydrogenase